MVASAFGDVWAALHFPEHPPLDGVACAVSRPLTVREGGVCSDALRRGRLVWWR